jgi:CheY-like chemotaxis protein
MPPTTQPRVLVVDDNHDNANLIQQYLQAVFGYPITVAYDGEEALRLYESEHPDIILLDVMMPGRDGWDVCRTIKDDPQLGSQVRIVMVTGFDDIGSRRRALQNGADDFLEKPFKMAGLAATIRRNVAALISNAA